MKFTIEDTLLRAVVDYLVKQPYLEVQKLIAGLTNLPRQETKDTKQVPTE